MITLLDTSITISKLAWSKNQVWYELQADANFATYDNYFVEVQISFSGDTYIFKQAQSPDTSGNLLFEIDGILESMIQKKLFENHNNLPTYNQIQPSLTEQPYNFLINFQEFIEGVASSAINETFLSFSAGLDADDFSYEKQAEWLFSKLKFLTSTALEKPMHPDIIDFLYFYNVYTLVPTIDVNVRLMYDDGTNNNYVAFPNFATDNKIAIIPTGFEALDIYANQVLGKRLIAFVVWISQSGNANLRISEVIKYKITPQPELEKRAFLFGNSLGGYETFFCNGNIQEQIASKKTVLKRLYGKTFRLLDGESFAGEQEGKRKLTAATGWLSNGFADALQDAAISKEIWEITDKGFLPIIIDNIQAVYYEKNNELIGYVFSGNYAHEVNLYTKDLDRETFGLPIAPPPPPPMIASGLKFDGQKHWLNLGNQLNTLPTMPLDPVSFMFTFVPLEFNDNYLLSMHDVVSPILKSWRISYGSSIINFGLWTDPNIVCLFFINYNFTIGQKYHVAFCKRANLTAYITINGQEFEAFVIPFNFTITDNTQAYTNSQIGSLIYDDYSNYSNHIVFDAKIYSNILPAAAIVADYMSEGEIAYMINLFAWYRFIEKTGLSIKDYSGNNRNGTMQSYDPAEYSFGLLNHHVDKNSNPITS